MPQYAIVAESGRCGVGKAHVEPVRSGYLAAEAISVGNRWSVAQTPNRLSGK